MYVSIFLGMGDAILNCGFLLQGAVRYKDLASKHQFGDRGHLSRHSQRPMVDLSSVCSLMTCPVHSNHLFCHFFHFFQSNLVLCQFSLCACTWLQQSMTVHRAAAMTLRTVLLSLQALLSAAEPDDPQDAVVAKQYKESPEVFNRTARHWASVYAGGKTLGS